MYTAVESAAQAAGSTCFKTCGPERNTSSACWIKCFYATTLGVDSGTKDTNATSEGLPTEQLVAIWERPFGSTVTSQGGCPDTSGKST